MPDGDRLQRLMRVASPSGSAPAAAEAPGLYPYERDIDGARVRFHLRVELDGRGLLLANAAATVRLTPSGAVIARGLLEGDSERQITRRLETQFRGTGGGRIAADVAELRALIDRLADPGVEFPVLNLDDPAVSPRESRLLAPFAATVELGDPERMRSLVEALWAAGIPHVRFDAMADADPAHVVAAVECAEDTGLVAGVRAAGAALMRETLLADLAQAGLDHLDVPLFSPTAEPHDALFGGGDHAAALACFDRAREEALCPVGEIAVVSDNFDALDGTLALLREHAVENATVFAIAGATDATRDGALSARALPQVAQWIEELAEQCQVRCVWNPPVERDPRLPLAEQVRAGPRCAGDVAIRVRADGAVIPARGPWRIAGYLGRDAWETIWADDAFRFYRERVEAPTRCDACPGLATCAADCPCDPAGWARFALGGGA